MLLRTLAIATIILTPRFLFCQSLSSFRGAADEMSSASLLTVHTIYDQVIKTERDKKKIVDFSDSIKYLDLDFNSYGKKRLFTLKSKIGLSKLISETFFYKGHEILKEEDIELSFFDLLKNPKWLAVRKAYLGEGVRMIGGLPYIQQGKTLNAIPDGPVQGRLTEFGSGDLYLFELDRYLYLPLVNVLAKGNNTIIVNSPNRPPDTMDRKFGYSATGKRPVAQGNSIRELVGSELLGSEEIIFGRAFVKGLIIDLIDTSMAPNSVPLVGTLKTGNILQNDLSKDKKIEVGKFNIYGKNANFDTPFDNSKLTTFIDAKYIKYCNNSTKLELAADLENYKWLFAGMQRTDGVFIATRYPISARIGSIASVHYYSAWNPNFALFHPSGITVVIQEDEVSFILPKNKTRKEIAILEKLPTSGGQKFFGPDPLQLKNQETHNADGRWLFWSAAFLAHPLAVY